MPLGQPWCDQGVGKDLGLDLWYSRLQLDKDFPGLHADKHSGIGQRVQSTQFCNSVVLKCSYS